MLNGRYCLCDETSILRKRSIITDMKRKIILIGGAPTVGKSTMAGLLSKHLGLPWISTDQTREIMRAMANKSEYPDLYNADGHDAVSFLTTFSAEEITDMEFKQGIAAWPGNKKLIEGDYTWRQGFIVEGVNILPELIPALETSSDIRPVFLIDDSEERMREVVFGRGLWEDAHKYPDDVKEKEVEWATIFSKRLEASAFERNYPVVKINKDSEKDLQTVISALGL